ncbi:MAG: hypothetical protein AAGI38_07060 [Bacteroidota bacterium]
MNRLIFFLLLAPLGVFGQLQVELVVPIATPSGDRLISLDRYERVHVLLRNTGAEPIRLWKDWNSWGYFNLYLILELGNTSLTMTRKHPGKWEGDFPDFWLLPPGETVVLEVDFGDAQWKNFPDLYGESLVGNLKAIYENKSDVLAEEYGVWVGRLESQPLQVMVK